MKTDLSKILAISGKSGLYRYISQGKSGVIVEALADSSRTIVSLTSKITALKDVSIYTENGETSLQEVFVKMGEVLGGKPGPSHKAADNEIRSIFDKALPDYDGSRFYVSHMKKALEWYNCLVEYASLDFTTEDEEQEA